MRAVTEQLEGARLYAEGAGAPPNPELQVAATLGDPDETANSLVQRFELGGQPALRSDMAVLEVQAARADLSAARRQVALRVGAAYYGLWEARERLRVEARG
ncbi:MAG: TolC family protein, partial [Candidatus Eremiobacterota bacterium]